MPRRMAAVWTKKSIGEFLAHPVPLSLVSAGRTDFAFKMSDEWEQVVKYTDPAASEVIDVLARTDVPVPEPGAEVGPDESVWQVEMAWEEPRVAVVLDVDENRDRWLSENAWHVFRVDGEDGGSTAGQVVEMVKGGRA